MSEENRPQQSSAESTVAGAAKTGKAIASIAKGAATGGAHGAAVEAAKSSKKWIIPIVAVILLPVLIIAMLPSVIFGSLFGDGTDTPNGISDDTVLVQNLADINSGISMILSEGLNDVLARIDSDFAASGCDSKEVNNPFGSDVVFNANAIVSQYCAYKDTDATSISKDDMESLLAANKDKLYSFTYTDEVREVPSEPEAESTETVAPDTTTEEPPEPTYETIRVYTISYNGEAYFADQVFHLSDDQKLLASQYAQNLTVLLGDGVYQGLSETEFSALGLSYDGVIFSDGETQVVYYNQLDERWKYELYGTDTIGGYACGPTAMSIVVSSLTSETVDPPHMAQWAYENGYWCSGNGSYHSLIPGAAEAWGLSVEGCTATEPQRIVDALADGKLVVAIMTKGHFTSSGHFIVLRGCTADGKILVADPSSYKRSEKSWDILVMRQVASDYDGISHELFQIANNLERMDQFNPQQKLFSLVRNAEVSTVSLRNLTARTVRDDTAHFYGEVADLLGIRIDETHDWLKITVPAILPKRNQRDNQAFLTRPLRYALLDFLKENPMERFGSCAICIVHNYDEALGKRRIRDYDNIETKRYLDVIESMLLTNDSGLLCTVLQATKVSDRDCTEFYLMRPETLSTWAKNHIKSTTNSCFE